MKRKVLLLIFAIGLIAQFDNVFGAKVRGEIQRYTLLRDRVIVDRQLRSSPFQSFIMTDLVVTSGLKDLLGEIKTGTDDSSSAIAKQLNMFELLSKYVNTEQFIDFDIGVGAPLPDIKIKKYRLLSSFFYQLNFGVMATISNQVSVLDPSVQSYVKKEIKTGVGLAMGNNKKEAWHLNLYRLARADLGASLTSTSLATDGKLFNFDQLNDEHVVLAADIKWQRHYRNYYLMAELRELKLHTMKSKEILYGNRAFAHLQFARPSEGGLFSFKSILGLHYRKWYALSRGLYMGLEIKYKKIAPFAFLFKMSNQFFMLNPQANFKFFRFSYSYKSAFRNPQDNIWAQGMHNFVLAVPFP